MDCQLQVVTLPVSDVDKAKAFYTRQAGFTLDVDYYPATGFRVVQFTPPSSASDAHHQCHHPAQRTWRVTTSGTEIWCVRVAGADDARRSPAPDWMRLTDLHKHRNAGLSVRPGSGRRPAGPETCN
jgi:catechol 2,3-dioxygenase-like lactoylglutathione lyase family enzyme